MELQFTVGVFNKSGSKNAAVWWVLYAQVAFDESMVRHDSNNIAADI